MNLTDVRVTDKSWLREQEKVRTAVLPYQWEALNDRVPGAAKSYAIHNMRAAKALRERSHEKGFQAPVFGNKPFQILPEDPDKPDPDAFYGFLFQDSDLYKWIEAASYSLAQHPDPALSAAVKDTVRLIAGAQAEDGYLNTYYILNGRDKAFTNLRDNHELYCFGHLTEAAVAYAEATGDDTLLHTAERFAACIHRNIGPEEGKKHGYPGHEVAEMALVKLYEKTGNELYLDMSRYFIDERGKAPNYFDLEGHSRPAHDRQGDPNSYYQAHRPVREQDEAVGHAVRAMYLYSGMADIARLTGDESLKAACRKLFESVSREKMYVTGGVGSTHIGEAITFPFDLPNDLAYTESCAAIGLCFFAWRMLRLEPEAACADVMERALYNNVLSGMALDGESFFYVNPLEVWPEACRRDLRKSHVKAVRQKWFGCACCPPNIARILTSLGRYIYTEDENTLYTHLYIGSEAVKQVGNTGVKVDLDVDRRERDKWIVRALVRAAGTGFTLALRIPGWCRRQFAVKGAAPEEITEKNGYLYIRKNWGEAEEITLTLGCPVRFIRADTRVREDAGKIAVTYGPFVYCMEEKDNGKDLHLAGIAADTVPADVKTADTVISGQEAVCLLVPGLREKPVTGRGLYFDADEEREETEKVTLKMIPYYMWANRGENEMQVWTRIMQR